MSKRLYASRKIDEIQSQRPNSGITFGYDGHPGFDGTPNHRTRKLWRRLLKRWFLESAERNRKP